MSSSDLSPLSSALSSDNEIASEPIHVGGIDRYFKSVSSTTKKASPPAKKKRPPSPLHEYVLADNPDIAFICIFRARFSDAFPKSLPHLGPQDIERGVIEPVPGEQIERLLCGLLGLVLNRKKEVERGHFQRALEEAIQTHASQWPLAWAGKNPLHGGGSWPKMDPTERLTLLKALIIWSLGSSEAIQAIIKESYKQQRHDDDLNQPLSVQSWGRDVDKRRFWLIEGQDDTHFRLYRESNPALKHNTWRSVAGKIDELKEVANLLGEEGSQASRRLQDRILLAIPRFEASEEKRKRRDYRNARKAQFIRPDPGFSLYEGRTRGKRIRYTFSDEEEGGSDTQSTRRSNRQSGISTPAEPAGPTFTASGRQVRSRVGGAYGEIMHSGQHDEREQPATVATDGTDEAEEEQESTGRPRRSAYRNGDGQKPGGRQHIEGYNSVDSMEDESDATSSGGEWQGGDDDEVDDNIVEDEDDVDADMSDNEASNVDGEDGSDGYGRRRSLVISLRYQKNTASVIDKSIPSEGEPPKGNSTTKQETPESRSYVAMQTRSPAPPITNIHAAVAEPSTNPFIEAGPISYGTTLDQKPQFEQETAPGLS